MKAPAHGPSWRNKHALGHPVTMVHGYTSYAPYTQGTFGFGARRGSSGNDLLTVGMAVVLLITVIATSVIVAYALLQGRPGDDDPPGGPEMLTVRDATQDRAATLLVPVETVNVAPKSTSNTEGTTVVTTTTTSPLTAPPQTTGTMTATTTTGADDYHHASDHHYYA
ncbi:hypothetical protein MTO96_017604 [Rhipicephalus appendiculatus]